MNNLAINDKIPSIELINQNGEIVSLDAVLQKKKWIILYFYPKALTPGCTLQATDLRDYCNEFQSMNTEVFGVSADDPKLLKKFQDKEQLNFTLLSDTEFQVAKLFGVYGKKKFMGREYMGNKRETFIINPDGVIVSKLENVKAKNHRSDLMNVLKSKMLFLCLLSFIQLISFTPLCFAKDSKIIKKSERIASSRKILKNAEKASLHIVSYNVENLFDTDHDLGSVSQGKDLSNGAIQKVEHKLDYTFLPSSHPLKSKGCNEFHSYRKKECLEIDWTDDKLQKKISTIKEALTVNGRKIPDILGVIEVENKNVLGKLGKALGHTHWEITDSPDERGIDVGLIFSESDKLKMISKKEIVVTLENPTRNILEVEFLVQSKFPLTVFVNHWPSLSNPQVTRMKAAETLKNRMLEILKENPKMHFVAMGDFNTLPENSPHPFNEILLKDQFLADVSEVFFRSAKVTKDKKDAYPQGTYFYGKDQKWNMLDRFFISQNLMDQSELDLIETSFQIYSDESLMRTWETKNDKLKKPESKMLVPKSFKHELGIKEDMGVSDHLAISLEVEFPIVENKKSIQKVSPKK